MSDLNWWVAAMFAIGIGYLAWSWRDAREYGRRVTGADMRRYEQAMRSTVLCPRCGGLGRVEREA